MRNGTPLLYALLGFIGSVALAVWFGAGFLTGWRVKGWRVRQERSMPEPVSEREQRKMKEEQEAFSQLRQYGVEQAYGMMGEPHAAE